jgi:hypothetical protein
MKFLLEGATERSPALIAISLQGMSGLAQSIGIPMTSEVLARIPGMFHAITKVGPTHMILVGRKGSDALDPIRAIASTRLVMSIHQGRIFVHGVAPWTPKFVLTEGSRERPYQLLRVV